MRRSSGTCYSKEPRVSNHGRLVRLVTEWAERILENVRSTKETVDGADDLIAEMDEHCPATRRRRNDSRSSTWQRSGRGKRPHAHRGTGQPSRGKRRKKTRRWSWSSDGSATITTMHSQIRNMEGTLVTQEKGPRTVTADHKTFSVQRLPKLRVQAKLDGVRTNAAYTIGGTRSCVQNVVKGSPVCLVT